MTTKEIVKGLKFRLKNLEDGYKVIELNKEIGDWLKADYEARIDEVESVIHWIEGMSGIEYEF